MEPLQVLPLRVRVDLREIVMKGYAILDGTGIRKVVCKTKQYVKKVSWRQSINMIENAWKKKLGQLHYQLDPDKNKKQKKKKKRAKSWRKSMQS